MVCEKKFNTLRVVKIEMRERERAESREVLFYLEVHLVFQASEYDEDQRTRLYPLSRRRARLSVVVVVVRLALESLGCMDRHCSRTIW